MDREKNTYRKKSRGRFLLSVLVFLLSLWCTEILYDSVYEYSKSENVFPVSRVEIRGELKYLTRNEIADATGLLAGGRNLVTLNTEEVHNMLLRIPWVAAASVQKRYPDTLLIDIKEHFPSALWKDTGIYDASTGTVFYPDLSKFKERLIKLTAPHDNLAAELYDHASDFVVMLNNSPYKIEEVRLDASRGYRILLYGDVTLILGRDTTANLTLSRLRRFLLAFPHTGLRLSDVSYVDLRYDNGFAVGEKTLHKESAATAADQK